MWKLIYFEDYSSTDIHMGDVPTLVQRKVAKKKKMKNQPKKTYFFFSEWMKFL